MVWRALLQRTSRLPGLTGSLPRASVRKGGGSAAHSRALALGESMTVTQYTVPRLAECVCSTGLSPLRLEHACSWTSFRLQPSNHQDVERRQSQKLLGWAREGQQWKQRVQKSKQSEYRRDSETWPWPSVVPRHRWEKSLWAKVLKPSKPCLRETSDHRHSFGSSCCCRQCKTTHPDNVFTQFFPEPPKWH